MNEWRDMMKLLVVLEKYGIADSADLEQALSWYPITSDRRRARLKAKIMRAEAELTKLRDDAGTT